MFNIDEKSLADNRTLITTQTKKSDISPLVKNGTLNYVMESDSLWITTPKIRQAYITRDPKMTDYLDRVLIANNGHTIAGEFNFKDTMTFQSDIVIENDMLVKGDFTVEGESYTIDATKLTIEDNVIELNRKEKSAGIVLGIAGTALNRGSKPYARYLYSEPLKGFVLDTVSSIDEAVSDKWAMIAHTENVGSHIAGEVRVAKKLTVPLGNLTDLIVANNSTLKNIIASGTLSVAGSVELKNTLVSIGNFTTKANSSIEGNLVVNNTSLLKKAVTLNNTLTVDETSLFKKLSTFNQGIVIGSVGANITGTLNVTGNTSITGAFRSTENATFIKDINVTGMTTALNLTATSKLKTLDAEITQDLIVKRNATITGSLAVNNNVTINASKTLLNSLLEVTGDTQITGKDLRLTCANDGSKGDLTVDGDTIIKKTLTVNGSMNLIGGITSDNLIANIVTAKNNFKVENGDGKGISFWNSDNYKIYMSTTTHSTGGAITDSSTSDYNMYFKMSEGTNRGFVFKNGNTSIMQIESTGKIRTIDHIYSKNSQVLRHADMGHSPSGNTAINACMVDGKHSSDLILRDGSNKMIGDLNLDTFKLRWHNNDYIDYDDTKTTVATQTYSGKFKFIADDLITESILEAGAIKLGNLDISGKNSLINGIREIHGAFGKILTSTDEWLKINEDNSHTNGTHFGTSLIRTDNGIHIGQDGSTFLVNNTVLKYKQKDILTSAGHTEMLGSFNMSRNSIKFNSSSNTGTDGAGLGKNAEIFAEHNNNSDLSRLVVSMLGTSTDSIVFRTSESNSLNTIQDSLIIKHGKSLFSNNPYCIVNNQEKRLLHSGDIGSGNNLDADKLDGKHYSDLVNQFVDITGDTMTGKLIMNNVIDMKTNKVLFNSSNDSYISAGGAENNSIYIGASNSISFYPSIDVTKTMVLNSDGTLDVLGSKVLRVEDCGHGKNIDADKIDGLHLSDLDNKYVNTSGDTMIGDLIITKDHPVIGINDPTARGRIIVANGISYIQSGKSGSDNSGILNLTGYNGHNLLELNILIHDKSKAKISGYKILTESDEGHGNGIDADTLDGLHKESFSTSTHNHDGRYTTKEEVDMKSKYKISYNDTSNSLDFMYIG